MNLESLLQRADIWRGGAALPAQALPCGFAELDRLLPGGGLPRGALTEILIDREGIGELSLLLPALARATEDERWLVFVAPPHIPYAPALARAGVNLTRVLVVHPHAAQDSLWAIEQALRAGTASVVLAWLAHAEPKALRRLQLAAEAGGSLGVLYRTARGIDETSPAALRLKLEPASLELATGASLPRSPRLDPIGELANGAPMPRAPADVQDARMPRRPGMAGSGLGPIGESASRPSMPRGPRLPDEVEGPETGMSRLGTRLDPIGEGARIAVHILKRRGGWPIGPVLVEVDHAVARPLSPKPSTRGFRARLPRV